MIESPATPPSAAEAPRKPRAAPADGVREVIDFVLVVLTLLFVFRAFVAEAFVIPTGSMAPTLMGMHKDLRCANCGFPYQVNASADFEPPPPEQTAGTQNLPPRDSVAACTCPVCRFTMRLDEGERLDDTGPAGVGSTPAYPSYSGDRIMVSKAAYLLAEPQRFDVVVFKYPAEAATNFIKRLVGLPNETIKIIHGDVFVRPAGGDQYTMARKPPDKVLALLQVVHDQDFAVQSDAQRDDRSIGWAAEAEPDDGAPSWQTADGGRAFETRGPGLRWLRYRHTPPSYTDRAAMSLADPGPGQPRPPQLIIDFTAYNTNRPADSSYSDPEPDLEAIGLHWVGDLALEAELTVLSEGGELTLELVEGGRRCGCRIDLKSGLARLSISGLESFQPTAQTAVRGLGTHRLRFANVDDQLLLWVDNRLVEFHATTAYEELGNATPTLADLAPVGVAADGAAVRLGHLRVLRDGYYIAARDVNGSNDVPIEDYSQRPINLVPVMDVQHTSNGDRLARLMSEPGLWPQLFALRRGVEFRLGADEFLVLGDNSPRSKDSRFWSAGPAGGGSAAHAVPRKLLIGKAVLIYWPHTWNRTSRDGAWFPLFPNLERMGLVR